MGPLGVVLLNSGGPGNLEEVQPFLRNLFRDPRLVPLPGGRWLQALLAAGLARARRGPALRRYRANGGASPLVEESRALAVALSGRTGLPVACAMRYSSPGVPSALQTLASRGVERIVAVSLHPQYSRSTTLSAWEEWDRWTWQGIGCDRVECWPTLPGFIRALAEGIRGGLARLAPGAKSHVLLTAHGLPVKSIRQGDPYLDHVQATADAVRACLPGHEVSLAFQSRLGPGAWLRPGLREALAWARRQGATQLVVCPISFVTENLETRYDLDIEFRQQCLAAGIETYLRVPAVSRSETFQKAMADMITQTTRASR